MGRRFEKKSLICKFAPHVFSAHLVQNMSNLDQISLLQNKLQNYKAHFVGHNKLEISDIISEISNLLCPTKCAPSRTKKYQQTKSEISDLLCPTNCAPGRTKKHLQNKSSKIFDIYRKFSTTYYDLLKLRIFDDLLKLRSNTHFDQYFTKSL